MYYGFKYKDTVLHYIHRESIYGKLVLITENNNPYIEYIERESVLNRLLIRGWSKKIR